MDTDFVRPIQAVDNFYDLHVRQRLGRDPEVLAAVPSWLQDALRVLSHGELRALGVCLAHIVPPCWTIFPQDRDPSLHMHRCHGVVREVASPETIIPRANQGPMLSIIVAALENGDHRKPHPSARAQPGVVPSGETGARANTRVAVGTHACAGAVAATSWIAANPRIVVIAPTCHSIAQMPRCICRILNFSCSVYTSQRLLHAHLVDGTARIHASLALRCQEPNHAGRIAINLCKHRGQHACQPQQQR
mmetsp:Transcript_46656/g.117352  ORF Transcript_46656/g.117352 Transcript_46656/m.117352 type:complete len:248 (+) Transcript_46656:804-1547(+)